MNTLLSQKPVIAIVGPTASGKSVFAIEIAQKINGEIIGVDSRQIYQGLEIGTAQLSEPERKSVPHHLMGIRSPDEAITAGEYARLANSLIEKIKNRGMNPIICGGSGLYYRAVVKGIIKEGKSDIRIRKRLEKEYSINGKNALWEKLFRVDPKYSNIVHPNNQKRLLRALEIFEITGEIPSEHYKKQNRLIKNNFDIFTVFLTFPLKDLEIRIRDRVRAMLQNGWVQEVIDLKKEFQNIHLYPLDSIGYQQILDYLNHKLSYEKMVDKICLRTRQYARKQIQWFMNEPYDLKLNLSNDGNNILQIDKILKEWNNSI